MSSETSTTFKSVRSLSGSLPKGALNIVRPSKLAEEGFTGLVVEGIYEGATPNKFNPEKNDYKVRQDNGDLTIINDTGSLNQQMKLVTVGALIQINYNGKKKLTKGKYAGKMVHDFEVLIA